MSRQNQKNSSPRDSNVNLSISKSQHTDIHLCVHVHINADCQLVLNGKSLLK